MVAVGVLHECKFWWVNRDIEPFWNNLVVSYNVIWFKDVEMNARGKGVNTMPNKLAHRTVVVLC